MYLSSPGGSRFRGLGNCDVNSRNGLTRALLNPSKIEG
jgi:hypothetical protein